MDQDNTKSLIGAGVRSIAASFPVTASIAQAWNEYSEHQRNQRVNEFFEEIPRQFEAVEERLRAVEEYIQSAPETAELLERTVENVQRESDPVKRKAFAILLTNSLCEGDTLTSDDKRSFVELLDALTEYDLNILRRFWQNVRMSGQSFVGRTGMAPMGDPQITMSDSRNIVALSKLESRGLIGETVEANARTWTGDATHVINRWRFKTLELLPLGRTFLNLLRDNTEQ